MTTETPRMVASQPRVFRNDYSVLEIPSIGQWTPSQSVSVVIPARGGQEKLDLVLAALADQSYPSDLLEVIVVDDGSETPLRLPDLRAARSRIVRVLEHQWGIANAVNTGIEAAEGEIIMRVDSDTVLSRVHIESQARWHHAIDYAMVLATILYVADPEVAELSPSKIAESASRGRLVELFVDCEVEENWGADRIRQSDRLRQLEARAFSVANGPSCSFRKDLWKEAGGLRSDLLLGEDTELGYRIAQHGGVVIPDQEATAWHLGATAAMTREEASARARNPAVANVIPLNRYLRKSIGRIWEIPLVEVVVDTAGTSFEAVRDTVDSLLADRAADVSATLAGDWGSLTTGRYSPMDDEQSDLRHLQRYYSHDSRVKLVENRDRVHPTAPFCLKVRAGVTLTPGAIAWMVDTAELRRVGLMNILLTGGEGEFPMVLERTAAVSRARRLMGAGESLTDAVDSIWGVWFANGDEWARLWGAPEREVVTLPRISPEVEILRGQLAKAKVDYEKQLKRAEDWKRSSQEQTKRLVEWRSLARYWKREAELKRSKPNPISKPSLIRRAARKLRSRLRRR